ncbi:MAG: RecQ family ATP-dependent DNA helicase, partial [Chloroflexia bacterium]|nr:RecQ family ATP-dependent DNA helicase [Chloroflexia bacterium]
GTTGTSLEERAHLAMAADVPVDAEHHLRQRIELAPSATARLALGRFLLDAGRYGEAAAISHHLDQTDPDLATVEQFRVRVARATGAIALARETLEAIVDRKPDNIAALTELAELALTDGRADTAAAILEHALELADDEPPLSTLRTGISIYDALGDRNQRAQLLELEHDARERAEARVLHRRLVLAGEIEKVIGAGGPHPPASPPPDLPRLGGGASPNSGKGGANATDRTTQSSVLSPQSFVRSEPQPLQPLTEPIDLDPRVLPVLREQFGFAALRPGQAEVIGNVLAGRDTLATMPTGAGKSLTFQLPAMLLDGVTLVLSPLIALMKDQVEGLPPAVRDQAVLVNSSLSPDEQRDAQARIAAGEVKLVYAAPERLRQASFLSALREAGVALVVIDEAHCISLWGHDFRPDYLSIPVALADFGDATVLGITATATPEMADAIAAGLKRPLHRVRASVFRDNLFYEVHRLANKDAKVAKLLALANREQGPGIIYASSRRDTETIAGLLRGRGINAVPYHAGLERELRAENQRRFMSGQARVVVATVAFGMGVDKANVRWIIHLSPPMSVAAYAQESGRAGRDAQLSHCVLLCTNADRTSLLTLARRDEIDLATLRHVYAAIQRRATGHWALLDLTSLVPDDAEDPYAERDRTRIALGVLEQAGLVTRHPDTPASRSISLREAAPDGDDVWQRFRDWSRLAHGNTATIRTADACAALDLTPSHLTRLLADHAGEVSVRDGARVACLELHPAPPDTRATLERLLSRSRTAARERIDEVFAYAGADQCRHVVLAAHLGERIEPCGTICDVCTGRAARRAAEQPTEKAPRQRRETTAADARAALAAVDTLPFPVGKTGLIRLLAGSAESSIHA